MRNRHNRINMWTKNIHLRVIMISNKPVNLDAYNGPYIQFTSIYSSHSRAAQRQKQVRVELRANLLCYGCLSSWQISSSFRVLTLYIGFLIPSDLGSVCFYYNAFRHIVALGSKRVFVDRPLWLNFDFAVVVIGTKIPVASH